MMADAGWLKRTLTVLIIGTALLQPGGLSQPDTPAQESQWLTYLHDPARTSASAATLGVSVSQRWTHEVGGMIAAEPVIAGGRVYIGAYDGHLYALDLADGHEMWSRSLGTYKFKQTCGLGMENKTAGITASPTLITSTNTLYIAGADAGFNPSTWLEDRGPSLYAIDAATGEIRWRQLLSDNNDNYAWSSPLIANGKAYVGVASAGDCPLTQGQLVAVDLADPHTVHRVAMAPDALTVVPPDLTTTGDNALGNNYNFTATLTLDDAGANSAQFVLSLQHLSPQHSYPAEIRSPCDAPTERVALGTVQPGNSDSAILSGTFTQNTAALRDGRHFLYIPGLVPCGPENRALVQGTGGGIWSSPTWDAATNTVFVTTGTPTPPCVPQTDCTYRRSTVGSRSAAIVAVDATSLAVKGWWQVPYRQQGDDADFGATPTLCGRVLGVANKNGIFYALNADTPNLWQQTVPISRTLAVGGPNPEQADGSISSAACQGGVFYVAVGRAQANSACAGYQGQVWALNATTLQPRWANPHCTSLVIGAVTVANGLVIVGADCRAVGCARQFEMLDAATGAPRFSATANPLQSPPQCPAGADCPPLGDILSGAAVIDNLVVFGDNPICGPTCFFPITATVRALNALPTLNAVVPANYLPLVQR